MEEAFQFVPPGHSGIIEWEMVGPEASGSKQVSVWIGDLSKEGVAEPHTHDIEEQVYYVLEGSLRIQIGDLEFDTQAGDGSIYFIPPKTTHAVYALTPKAKVLVITSPAVLIQR